MGIDQSKMTASALWKQERAKKGLQILGAAGSAVLLCPVIVLAMPIIGAYELSQHKEEGERMMEGALGGLLGIVVAPLAPFYQFLSNMQQIFLRPALSLDRERAQGMLRLDFNYHNLAVVGSPGTGKSSFINALLGYEAAQVGEVETTTEPKPYRHPSLPSLALWDMPGAFDALLIVFDDRFMAIDIEFARKAMQYDIPVFFIRNKADLSIERKIKRSSDQSSTEAWASAVSQLTLEVKKNVYKNMKRFGLDTNQLYILSSPHLLDFVLLLQQKQLNTSSTKIQKLIHEKIFITHLLTLLSDKQKGDVGSL